MIISVASGKGGTGKTTVSTNLAVSLEREVKLFDCDVEEPNAHLFLNPEFDRSIPVFTFVPKIDAGRCTGCGKCAEICRFNALAVLGEKVLVFPELCHSCEGCRDICPEDAVGEARRELGVIDIGRRNGIFFVQGCLRIGEAMSPPLIRHVRSHAKPEDLVIIDAPPGTSCPAINAMKGTDFVLMVTEPTPFGLHDLKLAVEAVKVLDIPCGLVVNRSDIGDRKLWDYAEQENLPILLEIPFDRRIAEVYSRGQLLVEEIPSWQPVFARLYDAIVDLIETRRSIQ